MKMSRSPRRFDFTHDAFTNVTLDDSKPPTDSFSWKLWVDNLDIANEALNSKYIQGIANGNLDPISFGQYSIQDCAYCYGAQDDYLLIEHNAKQNNREMLAAFAKARYDGYVKYTNQILKEWHISNPSSILPGEAAQDYIEFEHKIAQLSSTPTMGVIAMIPCDQLWTWLAIELLGNNTPNNIYDFWITGNNDWNGSYRLDNFINSENQTHPINQLLAQKVYRGSMICELNFFRSACGEQLMPLPDLSGL